MTETIVMVVIVVVGLIIGVPLLIVTAGNLLGLTPEQSIKAYSKMKKRDRS